MSSGGLRSPDINDVQVTHFQFELPAEREPPCDLGFLQITFVKIAGDQSSMTYNTGVATERGEAFALYYAIIC